jgi:GH18 family chitinase
MNCGFFRPVPDAGGNCPADTTNIVSLYQELRAALPTAILTVASMAAKLKEDEENIARLHPYVDRIHIMTYDYSVSNIPIADCGPLAPNSPLFTPASKPDILQMSINYTVHNYLNAGVPPSKIMVGVPLYGRTWFNPGLVAGDAWQGFGQASAVQGKCCGPLSGAGGAAPGLGDYTCGTYMINEILAAAPQLTATDAETQSTVSYFNAQGTDGYTDAGVWVSWNDMVSQDAIVAYAKQMGLLGVFTFDSGMDTLEGGAWTYKYLNNLADKLGRK